MHDKMYASLSFLFHCTLCAKDIVRMYAYFKNAKLTYHKHDNMLNLLFLQVSMINCFYLYRLKISSYLVHHIMCHDWSIRIENILVFLSYTMSPPIHFQYVLSIASLIVKLFLLICFKTAIIIGKKNYNEI